MNLIAIAIACVVLVAGSYIGNTDDVSTESDITESTHEVLSEEVENEGDTSVTISVENNGVAETNTPTPTTNPTVTKSPTNTPTITSNMSGYIYPGSEIVIQSGTKISLRSTSDTDTITDWYKGKIRGEGMNIKTFVTTKANEKVLNKLVGASSSKEILIEIKKDPGSTISTIDVSITPQ